MGDTDRFSCLVMLLLELVFTIQSVPGINIKTVGSNSTSNFESEILYTLESDSQMLLSQ